MADNSSTKKTKTRAGYFLRRVWILCLVLAVLYFLFAGQNHTFWVEIILIITGIVSLFLAPLADKRGTGKK